MSIPTQKLIMQEVLDCFIAQGEPDTFSLFDRFYNGSLSDYSNQVALVFNDVFDTYQDMFQNRDELFQLNKQAKHIERSAVYALSLDIDFGLEGNDVNDFLDDQLYRSLGNLSDEYFIETFDQIPDSVSSLMLNYGAYKIAWYTALGEDIFASASAASDSLEFLHKKLNKPILSFDGVLAQFANRLNSYFILTRIDSVVSLGVSVEIDSANAQMIDRLGVEATAAYRRYQDETMLLFSKSLDTILANTEANLALIEGLQAFFDTELLKMDSLEVILENSPGDTLSTICAHQLSLSRNILTTNLTQSYMSGSLNTVELSSDLRALGVTDSIVFNTMQTIEYNDDIFDVVNFTNSLGHLKNGFDEGNPSVIGGTALIGAGAIVGSVFFGFDRKNTSRRFKKIFPKSGKKKILKIGAKGLANLGKGLIVGYVATAVLGDILSKQVTGPIMANIDLLRKQMNARFDIVDQKLNKILEVQIKSTEAIVDAVQMNREFMQFNFNNINYQLAEILDNQDQIQSDLYVNLIVASGNNHCSSNYETFKDSLNAYADLHEAWFSSSNLFECLKGLEDAFDGGDLDCSNINFFRAGQNQGSLYEPHEIETFEKAVALFNWLYSGNERTKAGQYLLLEIENTFDEPWFHSYFPPMADFGVDEAIALADENYIDAVSVARLNSYFTLFHPYFEVWSEPAQLEPYQQIHDYFGEVDQGIKALRLQKVIDYTSNLRCMADMAVAQQALMSGQLLLEPLYEIIFDNTYQGQSIDYNNLSFSIKQFCIDLLKSNAILSNNFLTYAIRKNYRMNDKFHDDSIALPPNLIFNGDFEMGDTGFVTNLEPFYFVNGQYAFSVETSSEDWCRDFGDFNLGPMFLADIPSYTGTPSANGDLGDYIYSDVISGVDDNELHQFTMSVAEAVHSNSKSEIRIEFKENNNASPFFVHTHKITSDPGVWEQVSMSFISPNVAGNQNINITHRIFATNKSAHGNNLMMDNLELVEVGSGSNLIPHGTFTNWSWPNNTQGWASTLNYNSGYNPQGYAVVDTAGKTWSEFGDLLDHTPKGTRMLVTNPEANGNDTLWMQEGIPVEDGQEYALSMWVAEAGQREINLPALQVEVNGLPILTDTVTVSGGIWQQFVGHYTHQGGLNDTVSILIRNLRNTDRGNNPLIDDIMFHEADTLYNPYLHLNAWEEAFFKYAYDHTPTITYPRDTVIFDYENEIRTDTSILEKMAFFEPLDFSLYDLNDLDEEIVYLNVADTTVAPIDCALISCNAQLQLPPKTLVQNDIFTYTEAYHQLREIRNNIDLLHQYVQLPAFYSGSWKDQHFYKAILTNQTNK